MTKAVRMSVVMCTYEGARFLQEQLDSIAAQTRLPDELVVCDDGSTDATPAILTRYAEAAAFPVRVRRNASRLGVARNFEQAISLARGEILALSDQDDVWRRDKLQLLEQVLSENPEAGYAFSDAVLVDEAGRETDPSLWKCMGFDDRQRTSFERSSIEQVRVLLRMRAVTGAAMAFRASLKPAVLPVLESWVHDEWIAFASSINGSPGVPIREALFGYRQHREQTIGLRRPGPLGRLARAWYYVANPVAHDAYERTSHKWKAARVRLESVRSRAPIGMRLLEAKVAHEALRSWICTQPRRSRLSSIAAELARRRYHRYSKGWKAALQDCLIGAGK